MDAHDAEADLAGFPCRFTNLRDGKNILIDHGIEEPGRHPCRLPEQVSIEQTIVNAGGKVDAPKNAALVRKERLLAAGVRGVDIAD